MSSIQWSHRGYAPCNGTSATSVVVMSSHAAGFGFRGIDVQADLAVKAAAKPATRTGPRTWSPPL